MIDLESRITKFLQSTELTSGQLIRCTWCQVLLGPGDIILTLEFGSLDVDSYVYKENFCTMEHAIAWDNFIMNQSNAKLSAGSVD